MFDSHFEVYLADTQESKEIHYNIRYQVYCEEMGFEDQDKFPTQMEFDEDDAKSIHFIIKNKITDNWVGAVRLIRKENDLLPIEKSCKISEKINNNDFFDTVEISRLCLVKDVRRGKDIDPPNGICRESNDFVETGNVVKIPSQNKLNRLIIWGLFHTISEYCFNNRIHFCYFMTTSILARVMSKGGLKLNSIGESCEHRGERFPFKIDAIKTFQNKMWEDGFNNSYSLYSEAYDKKLLSVG